MNEYPDIPGFAYADGGVVAPLGFLASGVSAGLKPGGKRDVALVAAEKTVPAAAVFTTNKVAAAPVGRLARSHRERRRARRRDQRRQRQRVHRRAGRARRASRWPHAVAEALGCAPDEVVVSSTGVIGVPLPVDRCSPASPRPSRRSTAARATTPPRRS